MIIYSSITKCQTHSGKNQTYLIHLLLVTYTVRPKTDVMAQIAKTPGYPTDPYTDTARFRLTLDVCYHCVPEMFGPIKNSLHTKLTLIGVAY